jgi:hypothetical protein
MKFRTDGPSYEELIRLMEVFSGDKDLMNWFRSLQDMAEDARCFHLRAMIAGMRANKERPDLIAAVEALISPDVFKAAVETVRTLNR